MSADHSAIASDSEQKVFEIAPGALLATSGWKPVSDFQEARAREFARAFNTTDVRLIAKALEEETARAIEVLCGVLLSLPSLHDKVIRALAGELMMHSCALAGRTADGSLGYVTQAYKFKEGRAVCEYGEYFGSQRQIFVSSGEPAQALANDPTIWTGEPVWVVRHFLSTLKRVCPTIGGPDQIAVIDRCGTRWITTPQAKSSALEALTSATAFFGGTATFAASVSGPYVQVGSAGLVLADNFSSPNSTVTVNSSGVSISKPSGPSLQLTSLGVAIRQGSLSGVNEVDITASGVSIYGPSGSVSQVAIQSSGISILGGGRSVVLDSSGATIYSVAGSTSDPYVSVSPSLVTIGGLSASGVHYSVNAGAGFVSVTSPTYPSALAQIIVNASGVAQLDLTTQSGNSIIVSTTLSGSASAGGAALPVSPVGFWGLTINGTLYKIPYYA